MPRVCGRARNIGRRTRNSQLVHDRRLNRTVEEHLMDNVNLRHQVACTRANENSEQRNQRLHANALRQRKARQRVANAHRECNQWRMQDNVQDNVKMEQKSHEVIIKEEVNTDMFFEEECDLISKADIKTEPEPEDNYEDNEIVTEFHGDNMTQPFCSNNKVFQTSGQNIDVYEVKNEEKVNTSFELVKIESIDMPEQANFEKHNIKIPEELEESMIEGSVVTEDITKGDMKKDFLLQENVFPCTYCNVTCSSFQYRKNHEAMCRKNNHSDSDRKYKCDDCNKKFKRKRELRRHMYTHTGEKLFSCELCQKKFTQRSNLNTHISSFHYKNKKFQCDMCEKKFCKTSDLSIHKRVHNNIKPFSCSICDKKFITSHLLTVHSRIHSGEKPFQCDLCDKKFTTSSECTVHRRSHVKAFCCSTCGKMFSRLYDLSKHMMAHTGEKPFSCDVCQKKFIRSHDLTKHFRVHTGEKPFSCDICNKSFSESGSLSYHIKLHKGIKDFSCDICNKKFTSSSSLKVHIRIHTGEKPFSCTLCNNKFTRSFDLKRHMKVHTSE